MTQAFNRDCMDAMKEYPDKYFDLAVVDPPYGINVGSQPGGGNREYIPFGGTRNQEYEAIKRERERDASRRSKTVWSKWEGGCYHAQKLPRLR